MDRGIIKYFGLALVVILIDQVSKFLVHDNMVIGTTGEINVIGEWFKLHYLLNPGMAFGLKSSHEYGKLVLTLFRIVAMLGIGYYIFYLYKKKANTGLIWCMSLVFGGAVGNVIDCTFYGVFMDNAPVGSPTPWLHGQVIDMLYFPLFNDTYPNWIPFIGGEQFFFFSYVFNIADSAVFLGAVTIILFQKKFILAGSKSHETQEVLMENSL